MNRAAGTIIYKPLSVMENASPARLISVTAAILFASAIMLFIGSKALLNWANDLPINEASDYVLFLAQTWHDWMDKIGLETIADGIHNGLRGLQDLRW